MISQHSSAEAIVAIWNNRAITLTEFLSHVAQLAERLPAKSYGINLCKDRYLFLVGFFALLKRGQTNLLPASSLAKEVNEIANDYAEVYILGDDSSQPADLMISQKLLTGAPPAEGRNFSVGAEHIAAVVYTSGSTGKSKPNIEAMVKTPGLILEIRKTPTLRESVLFQKINKKLS